MSRITNELILHNGYVEILVCRTGYQAYKGSVKIDVEDIPLIEKLRISNSNYALTLEGKSLAHIIMDHSSNMRTVVDHINGDSLDNRKANLRIVIQADNANNRRASRNNTGIVGIAERRKGNYCYYRATVTDRKHKITSGKTKAACKRYSKHFNISKLGRQRAFKSAQKWLSDKRLEFGYV